jgi:hypothetical protein
MPKDRPRRAGVGRGRSGAALNIVLGTMTQDEVLRALRTVRYSPKRGRRVGLTFIGRQSGYSPKALYRAVVRGWVSERMAEHLSAVLQNVTLSGGHSAFPSTLGPLDPDHDPRGGPRPARRPNDARLRSMRLLQGKSGGPHGAEVLNALSPGPHKRIRRRGVGRPNNETATGEANAAEQASERGPIVPPVIHLDVRTLLMKVLR